MKGLKEELELKVTKLEKDLENEKVSSLSLAASLRLAEDTGMMHKESYVTSYREVMRLRGELESAREDYSELQGHLVGNVNAAYENLKEQVRIIAPEADLTLFILDNIVRDGNIVPDEVKVSTSTFPPGEVGHSISDPDC